MKILLLLLFTMIPFLSISQEGNLSLTEEQQIEVYNIMKQEEFLLDLVYKKNDKIKELEDILKEDSELIKKLLQKIENLELINNNNKRYIEFQEQKFEIEKEKIKNKRFSVSIISGYGFTPEFKNNAFVGFGLSYSLFRF